jgi:hypothetical protein
MGHSNHPLPGKSGPVASRVRCWPCGAPRGGRHIGHVSEGCAYCSSAMGQMIHIGTDTETNIGDLGKLILQMTSFHPELDSQPFSPRSVARRCRKRTPYLRVVPRPLESRPTMGSPWLVIYGAGLGAFIFVAGALPAVWSENPERREAAAKFLGTVLIFRRSITHRREARQSAPRPVSQRGITDAQGNTGRGREPPWLGRSQVRPARQGK